MKYKALLIILFNVIQMSYGQDVYHFRMSGLEKYENKDYVGSIQDYTKYLENCNPEHHYYVILETYLFRAFSKALIEDYRGAIQDFDKIIELNKSWKIHENKTIGKIFNHKGNCKYFLNKKEDACLDYSRAIELGYSEVYEELKSLYNN